MIMTIDDDCVNDNDFQDPRPARPHGRHRLWLRQQRRLAGRVAARLRPGGAGRGRPDPAATDHPAGVGPEGGEQQPGTDGGQLLQVGTIISCYYSCYKQLLQVAGTAGPGPARPAAVEDFQLRGGRQLAADEGDPGPGRQTGRAGAAAH